MIIAILFLSISTKINKKLKDSSDFLNESKNYALITQKIKNKDFTNEKITSKMEIIFEEENSFSWTLKQKEKIEIVFNNTWSINIKILSWGPINFKFWVSPSYTNSWIITNLKTIKNSNSWTLILENIWWYTRFNINSNSSFTPNEKRYKIIEKIWNKKVEKSYWIIK